MKIDPVYGLFFLAGLTLVLVMWTQSGCGKASKKTYSESYDADLSPVDQAFVNDIIQPPPQFDTLKLQTYATSLQTGGNWGRGCECNFSRPSDGRGFQMTGYH